MGALLGAALLAASAAAEGTGGDLLGGFEDDVTETEVPEQPTPLRGESWALTGNLSLGGSVNFIPHDSATGTDYTGISKLRTRVNLQLDVDLPFEWAFQAEGFAYYDWAYLAKGRSRFTDEVLDEYEYDVDSQDVWIRGTLLPGLDAKLGRQVVSWGRSDTLRVLDVLNPVDNREPGIADVEDLKRAASMARFDYYLGDWSLSLLAIPEIRFSQNPVVGSDFFPALPTPSLPAGFPPLAIVDEKPDSWKNWEAGAALTGIFEGWDLSLHYAYYYEDFGVLRSVTPVVTPQASLLFLDHNRLWLAGGGGQSIFGNWLLKAEAAYVEGLGFTDSKDVSRVEAMLGVEYYGFSDAVVSLEAAHGRILDFPDGSSLSSVGTVAQEEVTQVAVRLTRSFLRERLNTTVVALLISGNGNTGDLFTGRSEIGSVIRIDGSYELRDALVLTAGVVLYVENDIPPLSTWGDNDRFFFELKYSF